MSVARPGYSSPPPPTLTRNFSLTSQASSVSSRGGSPSAPGGSDKKKRARTLLRDYYGLAATASDGGKKGDPMDMDSPSFNPELFFSSLASLASLPDLLRRENELITDIRELDGERQSLVYNHHSELIDASATIHKMKSRALALDASLDSLKASFQSISQLSTALVDPPSSAASSSSPSPTSNGGPPRTPPRKPVAAPTGRNGKRLSTLVETPATPSPTIPTPPAQVGFNPLLHLPSLLSLPILLRTSDRKAELWGQWEPALRSWEEEGVLGVREVGNECREALRDGGRGRSGSGGRGEVG